MKQKTEIIEAGDQQFVTTRRNLGLAMIIDVMRVRAGKITDHWGIANFIDLVAQLQSA